MKNKKTIVAIVTSLLVIFIVGISLLLYWTIPFKVYKTTNTNVTYNKAAKEIYVNSNTLKVLQLTDLHINGALDMPTTFSTIKKIVYTTKPDLVVFTGDIFSSGSSKKYVDRFVNFVEKLKLPWAAVLGNHDDETPYSLTELSNIIEYADNSLFETGNLQDLYGNYYYNIKFADQNIFQFIFMDSRSLGFTQQSIAFYNSVVESSKAINSGVALNNFLFSHIPLPEVRMAIQQYKNNATLGMGVIREEACVQHDIGFYDVIIHYNSTKTLIFGHDHVNNAKIKYNGIDFCYGVKTGISSYNDTDLVGGTLYTLNSNETYFYQDIII